MTTGPGERAASPLASLQIEPLEQEFLRLLQSEAVRGYLRQAASAALGPSRPPMPPELSAAGAIAERMQQLLRDLPADALRVVAGEARSAPTSAAASDADTDR
jgi:hypothetical protein